MYIEESNNNALSIGSMLREYKILSILGQGGFGITYKAKDTHLDKIMVIKEYMPNAFASRNNNTTVTCISKDKDTFEWGLQRFLKEAKILSKFDHISIVKAHRFFEANGTAYFVMDFYDGETLDEYINRNPNKQYTKDEILSVMMPIIEGLKAVHTQGFLHRDIAPDNIFLRIDKPPILIDFGASRNALGVQSQNISAIVKHGYSPPEQYTSNSIQDGTTDLYAISAVIYEMITGSKPPESTHRQTEILNDKKDPIEDIEQKYKSRFSLSFLKTVKRGLSIKQKDRIKSIPKFQKGLVENDKTLPILKGVLFFVVLGIGWYIVNIAINTPPNNNKRGGDEKVEKIEVKEIEKIEVKEIEKIEVKKVEKVQKIKKEVNKVSILLDKNKTNTTESISILDSIK